MSPQVRGLHKDFFDNQTTAVGTTETLSGVAMGDVLELKLYNANTNTWLTSDPSSDPGDPGVSHAYVTWYSANPLDSDYIAGIPAGVFVGMEDLGAGQNSDYDYNDDQYVVTGVSTYTGAGQPVPVGNRTSGSAGSGTPDASRLVCSRTPLSTSCPMKPRAWLSRFGALCCLPAAGRRAGERLERVTRRGCSGTRVNVSRNGCIQVDATISERRPWTILKMTQ